MTQKQRTSNSPLSPLRLLAGLLSTLSLSVLLAGCAGNMPANFGVPVAATPSGNRAYTGTVFGGQNPVSGATIQVYTVGTTGRPSAATALITGQTVTTNANGYFSVPAGAYSCSSASQVYLTASGGDSGSGNNPNLNLVAALGPCASASGDKVNINELTTVAAAYALAPFAASLTYIGAAGTNPTGLVNAFANAAALVNFSVGLPGGPNLPAGTVVPTAELDTLANIIASCVNSSGTGQPCSTLFSATGATETFGAALGIAKNPAAPAITALYTLSGTQAPFQPSYANQPNDFSIALTFNANGAFASPYGIAIDGSGDAWITNETGTTITELSPTGSVLATPTATGLIGAEAIALDGGSGNVWVANTAGNSLIDFPLSSGVPGSPSVYTPAGLAGPTAIALDSRGDVFAANLNGNSITALGKSGALLYPAVTNAALTNPSGIAVGGIADDVFVTSGNGSILRFASTSGALEQTLTDNALQGPLSVTYDLVSTSHYVVAAGFTTGSAISGALSEFTDSGTTATVSAASPLAAAFTTPGGIATDGVSVWVANSNTSGGLAQLSYSSGTFVSPAAGFGSANTQLGTSGLNTPIGVAVDASGSVWTTNSGSNTVSQFIGLAVPVATPIATNQQ